MADEEALEPYPGRRSRVVVPDVGGLFYQACLDVAGRVGLHLAPVLLTAHPMPVEGVVRHRRDADRYACAPRQHADSPAMASARAGRPAASSLGIVQLGEASWPVCRRVRARPGAGASTAIQRSLSRTA